MTLEKAQALVNLASVDELRALATEALLVDVYPQECCHDCGRIEFTEHAADCAFMSWSHIDELRDELERRLDVVTA